MATTKVITELTDLNQANSESGLRMPTGGAFSGTPDPGMMRNDTTQSSASSASTMQHYNGTDWKNFVNTAQCTTTTCDYPITATVLYQMESDGGSTNNVPDTCSNYDGTSANVTYATGKYGNAGVFNGNSSYITANTLPAIGTGDFGFSCWFYQNSGNQQGALFSTTTQWFAANGNNNPKVLMVTDDTVTKKGDTAYAQGVWNHAVFTRASGVLKIYQNGSEVFSGSYTDSWDMTQFGIGVARAVGSRVYYFNGKIDQIRLYNAALSAANVSTLYKEIECEPAAINALANFNTVLYPGNASTNQISTVGFAPGFTWIKARNTNTSPEAHDVVRGEPSRLWVDNAYAASTAYNGFVKLTSNGFDLNNVGSGGNVNRAYNYVAWNWKAALANLSTSFNGSSSCLL